MKIQIKQDINKDAWNWWDGTNKISHGVNWGERIDLDIRKQIKNKTHEQSLAFLIPYLENYYKENKEKLDKVVNEAQLLFDDKVDECLELMTKITKHPMYRQDFTCFLTTFPRCPYNIKNGYVWLCALWPTKCYLGTFLHELLHFQFIHYYYDNPEVKKLTNIQFEYLKESLTVILNYDFKKYLCQTDSGYEIHQDLRKKLADFWIKTQDFDKLVSFGAKEVQLLI